MMGPVLLGLLALAGAVLAGAVVIADAIRAAAKDKIEMRWPDGLTVKLVAAPRDGMGKE